jgi:hypothetical protein
MDKRKSSGTTVMPAERALSLSLDAEVMTDLDTGELSLVASTDPQLTDLAEVTSASLRELIAAAHAKLAAFERLADEQEARESLRVLLAENRLRVEEWDTATLDPQLRDRIRAVYDPTEGDGRTVIVPAGQDPIVRLTAVRELIAGIGGAA